MKTILVFTLNIASYSQPEVDYFNHALYRLKSFSI